MSAWSLEKVLACPRLPTLPTVALEVVELTRNVNVDMRQLATVIAYDQAISARVLRTVNSSYYGLAKPCGTIRQALAYLGLNVIKPLVLSFSFVDAVKLESDAGEFDFMDYWRRAVYSAVAARSISHAAGVGDPEEAFLAALMQDIGMVALYRAIGRDYVAAIAATQGQHRRLCAIEMERFGTTHAEIGAQLIQSWRFPERLVDAVRQHHAGSEVDEGHSAFSRLIELAWQASQMFMHPMTENAVSRFRRLAGDWFGLGLEATRGLIETIGEQTRDVASMLRVAIGPPFDARSLLARADQLLSEHEIAMERESLELQQANDTLARLTLTDPLTQIANRRRFDQELAVSFTEARAAGASLAVVMADIDHFKAVNDTYGHAVGDAALVQLAARLQGHLGGRCVLFRYGGEEFAMILRNAGRIEAARLAENLRRLIESEPLDISASGPGRAHLRITASFGIAATEPGLEGHFSEPQSLVVAADKALYAAKIGGRNAVRVYSPKPSAAIVL